jgi:hypothetical protein
LVVLFLVVEEEEEGVKVGVLGVFMPLPTQGKRVEGGKPREKKTYHSKKPRCSPGRYRRKSLKISVNGVAGIVTPSRLSTSGTIESFAPLSPRNETGFPPSSSTPSYTTPSGNMLCEVMPKINVRNDVYSVGRERAHMVSMVALTLRIAPSTEARPMLSAALSLSCSPLEEEAASMQPTAPAMSGPECRTISMCTSTKPASEEEGSSPCSKARMRRMLEGGEVRKYRTGEV